MDKILDLSGLENQNVPKKRKKRKRKPGKGSKDTSPELLTQKYLRELGIKFTTQYELSGKFYDIYIPSKNLLIEVDGDYWHGKDIDYPDKSKMQKRSFVNDRTKDGLATINGFGIVRIWESEITLEKVKELIYT